MPVTVQDENVLLELEEDKKPGIWWYWVRGTTSWDGERGVMWEWGTQRIVPRK